MENEQYTNPINEAPTDQSLPSEIEDGKPQLTEKTPEDIKFGDSHPFKTIMSLSLIPALLQTMNSLHDAIDLLFIKKAYGATQLTIVSISSNFRMLYTEFMNIHTTSLTYKASQFVVQHKYKEAAQLLVDYIRINFLMAIIFPVVGHLAEVPFIKTLGLHDEYMKEANSFNFPLYFIGFFLSTVSCFRNILNGIARPTLSSLTAVASLVFSLFVATPIVSFGCHLDLWVCQLAYYSGEIIMFFIFTVIFFKGTFPVKIEWKMFISKPSPDLCSALMLCLPSLIIIPFGMLAPAATLSKMNSAAGKNIDVATTLNAGSKPMAIILTLLKTLLSGFMSSGTWAFNKGLISRVKQLFVYSLVVPLGILAVIYWLLIFYPYSFMQIWLDEKYKPLVEEYIPLFFYGVWLDVVCQLLFFLMMVMNQPLNAVAEAVCKYSFQVAISFILAAAFPHNARKIGFAYLITSIGDLVFSCLFLTCPFYKYLHKKDDTAAINEPLIENTDN